MALHHGSHWWGILFFSLSSEWTTLMTIVRPLPNWTMLPLLRIWSLWNCGECWWCVPPTGMCFQTSRTLRLLVRNLRIMCWLRCFTHVRFSLDCCCLDVKELDPYLSNCHIWSSVSWIFTGWGTLLSLWFHPKLSPLRYKAVAGLGFLKPSIWGNFPYPTPQVVNSLLLLLLLF